MGAKFGVILTSYNKPRWVKRTIQSILDQTCEDWELWIVDDGSEKETLAILKEFRKRRDRRLRFYSEAKASWDRTKVWRPCAIFNKYVPRILESNEWLLRVSDDDYWSPELLEIAQGYLAERPFIRAAYVQADIYIEDDRNPHGVNRYDCSFGPHFEPKGRIDGNAQILHREVFDRLSQPWWREELDEETYIVDGIFANRVAEHFVIYPVPSMVPLYHHGITRQSCHTRLTDKGLVHNALITVDKLGF